jgi:hypothetical protein
MDILEREFVSFEGGPDAPPGDLYRAPLEQYQDRQDRIDSLDKFPL